MDDATIIKALNEAGIKVTNIQNDGGSKILVDVDIASVGIDETIEVIADVLGDALGVHTSNIVIRESTGDTATGDTATLDIFIDYEDEDDMFEGISSEDEDEP